MFAQLKPADIFSHNMVLQRGAEIPIWGKSNAGEIVQVEFNSVLAAGKANDKGDWKINLPPHSAGGPYALIIRGEIDSVVFENVLIGDVWFASGQSNMEHPLKGWEWIPHSQVSNYEQELEHSNYPQIRLFKIKKFPSPVAQENLLNGGSWEISSPATVVNFSSIGWFFAKELHHELNVPIGIIHSSWGGTSIQSWMSRESLLKFEDSKIPSVPKNFESEEWREIINSSLNQYSIYRKQISYPPSVLPDIVDKTKSKDCILKNVDLSDQIKLNNHVIWLQREFKMPSIEANQQLILSLGFLNRQSHIFLNGKEVGYFLYPAPVKLKLGSDFLKEENNILVIRLANPAKKLQVFGNKDDFFISSSNEHVHYNLSENWNIIDQLETIGTSAKTYQNHSSYLFNGMVRPIIPYALKGFIWYQGESNTSNPYLYEKLFIELITDWRNRWSQGDLPFLFFQLSNLERTHEFHKQDDSWSLLRESQKKALRLPETGMVVTIDIGDSLDIHPKNKKIFGQRLAFQALNVAYDKPILADGPTLLRYTRKHDTITLKFDRPLFLKNESANSIEIVTDDGVFYPDVYNFKNNNQLVIVDQKVKNAKIVRYAWYNNPKAIIFSENGIPAAPFIVKVD